MNNIISPFQLKKNMIVKYGIEQTEASQEYKSTDVSLGVDYKISSITMKNDTWNAQLDLLIILTGKTNNGETIFTINLDMMGLFEGNAQQIEKEKFNDMLKINGISTLMQLSRAYVTATTALSNFPNPINFPMVNVFELVKGKGS